MNEHSGEELRRWWRRLWTSPGPSAAPAEPPPGRARPPDPDGADPDGADPDGADPDGADPARVPARRRYTAPPPDDPRREADLGAVLQALAGDTLRRDELGGRLGVADWEPGRFDAVVAHGVATGVLREAGDGAVRARYPD